MSSGMADNLTLLVVSVSSVVRVCSSLIPLPTSKSLMHAAPSIVFFFATARVTKRTGSIILPLIVHVYIQRDVVFDEADFSLFSHGSPDKVLSDLADLLFPSVVVEHARCCSFLWYCALDGYFPVL